MHNPRSKSWNEFSNQSFDYVITVCNQAANESCPLFLGSYIKLHWSIPDPAKAKGTDVDIERAFDKVFELLKNHIENELF